MTYTLHPFGESWEIRLGERSVAQVYARSDATAIVDWFNSVEECDACMTFQPKDEMSNSNSYICTDARICDGCRDRARSA